jgi:hypothetical protein
VNIFICLLTQNCQEVVDVLICENAELKVKLRHIEDQAQLDRAVLCHTVTTKLAVEQQLQVKLQLFYFCMNTIIVRSQRCDT